jgi:hypothetical protein
VGGHVNAIVAGRGIPAARAANHPRPNEAKPLMRASAGLKCRAAQGPAAVPTQRKLMTAGLSLSSQLDLMQLSIDVLF